MATIVINYPAEEGIASGLITAWPCPPRVGEWIEADSRRTFRQVQSVVWFLDGPVAVNVGPEVEREAALNLAKVEEIKGGAEG